MTKAAVIQLTSNTDVKENLNQVELLLKIAEQNQVSLVLLPENFAFLGLADEEKLAIAEKPFDGPIQNTISRLSKQYGLWIIAGTLAVKEEGEKRVWAQSQVYNEFGDCVAHYNKIHLFDVTISDTESYKESNSTLSGDKIVCVETPCGTIGLSVCYDLRFPELYQALENKGAQLFSMPAAFTYETGKAHWQTLIKARAIENLAYVLCANQTGTHACGRQTYGHSMIVSPWGEVLANANEKTNAIVMADIDLETQALKRKQFPCLNHKKIRVAND